MKRIATNLLDFFLSEWTAIIAFVSTFSWVMLSASEIGANWLHAVALIATAGWMIMLMIAGTVTSAATGLMAARHKSQGQGQVGE